MMNKTMSTGEMARHYGVTTRLLRFWEAQGLISPERWGEGGYQRRYSPAERRKFEAAREAQALGMSIGQIAECQQEDGTVRVPVEILDQLFDQAKKDRSEVMDRIERVIAARTEAKAEGATTIGSAE